MSTRHPRRSHAADDTQRAREVDSLIDTMGLDPMAFEVNGEQQPDVRETSPPLPVAPAAADDAAWKTTIDPEVHAAELALVEAHAKAKLAVELERVKAEAAAQRQVELASQEAAAIAERERAVAERERAVAEARVQAEAAARESMASELARARTEAEQQLARELERSREQMERQLSERLGQSRVDADRDREANMARARAEAEATRAVAVQEARLAAEAAATRALEAELARVRGETESKLQAELASMREQAETARRQQTQAQQQAEAAREQAARDVQAAAQRAAAKAFEVEAARIRSEAESRLKEESARARTEASQRLEEEVAKLRTEQERAWRHQPAPPDPPAPIAAPQAPPTDSAAPRPAFSGRLSTADATEDGDEAPQWKVWAAAAAAAAAVVIIGTGGYLWWDRAAPPAKAPETAPEVALTEPQKPATPAPRARRSSRTDAPTAAKSAGAPVVDAGKTSSGLLTVFSRVPLDLVIDGVRVGSTDDGQIVVSAGRRRVELVNKRLNYRGEVTLDVASGQVTTHTATLPPGQLRIAGAPGGEVWVEGEHVGTLPLGDISVPLGTREVLVRHPLFGERRQTVEVTYGSPTQVSMLQQESGAGSPQDAASKLAPLSAPPPPRSDAIR